jgi:peptide/nickel transport system substrate-binding protein
MINPAGQLALRANGANAWIGWPDDPKLEALRDSWFDASEFAAQQKVARDIQAEAFQFLPYLPLGQYLQATAHSTKLSGVLNGFALFWNVRREA